MRSLNSRPSEDLANGGVGFGVSRSVCNGLLRQHNTACTSAFLLGEAEIHRLNLNGVMPA